MFQIRLIDTFVTKSKPFVGDGIRIQTGLFDRLISINVQFETAQTAQCCMKGNKM